MKGAACLGVSHAAAAATPVRLSVCEGHVECWPETPGTCAGRADYFGTLPNLAARLCALAHPGQVLVESKGVCLGHKSSKSGEVCSRTHGPVPTLIAAQPAGPG